MPLLLLALLLMQLLVRLRFRLLMRLLVRPPMLLSQNMAYMQYPLHPMNLTITE